MCAYLPAEAIAIRSGGGRLSGITEATGVAEAARIAKVTRATSILVDNRVGAANLGMAHLLAVRALDARVYQSVSRRSQS